MGNSYILRAYYYIHDMPMELSFSYMALKIPKLGSKCEKIALLAVLRGIRSIRRLNHAASVLGKVGEGPEG